VFDFGNIVVSGISNGCIYAIIGVGFVIIFRTTGVVSFAQGAYMMLGSLAFASIIQHGWSLAPSMAIVVAGLAILGGLTYWLIFARLVGTNEYITSVATIGLATVIEAIALLWWGPNPIVVPSEFSYQPHKILGIFGFDDIQFFTIAVTIGVLAIITFTMGMTSFGLRMRAVANVPRLAAYTGLNVTAIGSAAWAIAAGSGGLAGVLFLIGSQPDPGTVYSLGFAAFPAILLGGFDSVPGVLVGGILVGAAQAAATIYIGGSWQDVVAYGILLVVLLIRPQGLFGHAEVTRI
jgi:branched-chain amino acid transport system permease protein